MYPEILEPGMLWVPASSTASEVEGKEGRHGSKEAEGYRVDGNDGMSVGCLPPVFSQ